MNSRIKEIRKSLNMTQTEFAEATGKTRDSISNLELGRVAPGKTFIELVCRKFNVNETWLRTGEGEPFLPKSREASIAEMVGKALNGSSEFKKAVVQMICSRTDQELQTLASALRAIYENLDISQESSENPPKK